MGAVGLAALPPGAHHPWVTHGHPAASDAGVPSVASPAPRDKLIGILLLLGAVICFAGLDATAKWINQTTDPLLTAAIRYLGSFVVVGAVCNPWARPGLMRTRSLALQCGRALCLVLATVFSFISFRHLPLTEATSLLFAAPLIIVVLAGPLLREWPGPRRLLAAGVGFGGVLLVTRPGLHGVSPAVALGLVAAVTNALYTLATRRLAMRDPPLTTLFYTAAVGGAVMLPVLLLRWSPPGSVTIWGGLVLLGVLGSAGHWLLILAHQRAPASLLAPFFYAQLLGALVLGWLMFGEVPDRWTAAGSAIILLSGLAVLGRERR